jgi:hypothetical protein
MSGAKKNLNQKNKENNLETCPNMATNFSKKRGTQRIFFFK